MINWLFSAQATAGDNSNEKSRAMAQTILRTAIMLLIGFIVGGIVMLLGGFNPIQVYAKMFTGVFGSAKNVLTMVVQATPIIGTGLSVAFAYRAGLFNIGAEGQFIAGTIAAGMAGYFLNLPSIIHPVVVLLCAALFGGLFGAATGILKSKFGISEVISGIMLNWISLYTRNFFVKSPIFENTSNVSHAMKESARIGFMSDWKSSPAGKEKIASSQFLSDVFKTDINWGIIIIILVAVLVWFILDRTTTGFRIKAVGFNPFAAEYAGINVNANYWLTMFIAGAIAGLAGGLMIAGVAPYTVSVLAAPEGYGFNGIAVALLGNTSPLGSVLAGFLFSFLKYGGTKIQAAPIKAPSEIINIMIGFIVLFAGLPHVVDIISKGFRKKNTFVEPPTTPEIELGDAEMAFVVNDTSKKEDE